MRFKSNEASNKTSKISSESNGELIRDRDGAGGPGDTQVKSFTFVKLGVEKNLNSLVKMNNW